MRYPGVPGRCAGAAYGVFDLVLGCASARDVWRRGACASVRQQLFGAGLADLWYPAGNPPDDDAARAAIAQFEPQSLCHSIVKDGQAEIFTDFARTATV